MAYNPINLAKQVAALRRQYGLPDDPASDRIWVDRIMAGTHSLKVTEKRLAQKAVTEGVHPRLARDPGPVQGGVGIGSPTGTAPAPRTTPSTPTPSTPADTTPARNFRAEAQARFPWLTGNLLNEFVGFWSSSGSADAALGQLRQTAEYDRVFAGIKRPDGSLRMNESEYFSDKVGFSEVLREYGLNPAQYENQYVRLFENEVRAQEFAQAAASGYQRFVEPGANDTGLFSQFLSTFIQTGAEEVALREVRSSSAYDKVFVGNRREDGTLRMDEPEFFAYKRGWQRTLAGFGLNPTEFEARGRFEASVRGELSIQEVGGRLQAVQDGILDRSDQIKEFYARGYGLQLTNESILGMAIDPSVQRDLLERRITAGQIGGEAARQGFMRSVGRAEELARGGLTGDAARGLYSQAGQQLPGLSATTRRFYRGDTTISEFEDVIGLGDASGEGRLQSALREEQSQFTGRGDTRRSQDGFGLSGLRQR